MFSDDDMKTMKDGTWELPCMEMTLSKNDGKRSYSGPGLIRRNSDGTFNYLLMSPAKEDQESFDAIKVAIVENLSQKPPDDKFLMQDNDYWTLTARDKDCRDWLSERLPEPSIGAGSYPALFLKGRLDHIEYKKDHSHIVRELNCGLKEAYSKKYVTFITLDKFQIPANTVVKESRCVDGIQKPVRSSLSAAKFNSCGIEFIMEQCDEFLKISAICEKDIGLPLNILYFRISESLQFSLGRPLKWDICYLEEGNDEIAMLKSVPRRTRIPRVGPPLNHWHPENVPYVWKLFDNYLTYVTKNKEQHENFQPLSLRIWRVLQASTGSWEAEKLTLCVEIEGLLNEYLSSSKPPKKLEHAANAILDLIKFEEKDGGRASGLDKDSLIIVKTVVGNLKRGASAMNTLRQLQKKGVVRELDVKAWDSIRPPTSHGKCDTEITDELYGRRGRLMVLLYHIVFHIIGYEGPYTDYGTPRQNLANYRPKKITTDNMK